MTDDGTLNDCRVLVVEDEYLIAYELRDALLDVGAVVVGPVGAIEQALTIIEEELPIDVAVLDASLRGEMVFPVADRLETLHIPFVFMTGYDAAVLPTRFQHVVLLEKPVSFRRLCQALEDTVAHSH